MTFILLTPRFEPAIERSVSQHVSGRHEDPAAQEAFVGPLLRLLVSPVGAGEHGFSTLFGETAYELVRGRPGSSSLYRCDGVD